ncbi:MAG: cytochrome c biogenesis protein ResB [Pseudonocardiales bacterium]|nr:MAG: cytochrome c biogenesis protein ResB [Pseudonocardiales bacterium]
MDTATHREAESTAEAPRLSTAPDDVAPPVDAGGLGRLTALALRAWRRLTSMRTALVLLLFLALAAIPGTLLPQRPLNPVKVTGYLRAHPALGPLYDRFGLFDVFTAPWFASIYLLLAVSLVGCLASRLRLHARALLRPPPPAPRRLDGLPHYASFQSTRQPDDIATTVEALLRRKRWRIRRDEEPADAIALGAERGYLRETGNLVFHFALLLLLGAIAIGKMYGYSGTVVVNQGDGFCNTVSQFDSFTAGPLVDQNRLTPLCAHLRRFSARYTPVGIAATFRAEITYTMSPSDTSSRAYRLEVNHPLRRGGDRLYLLGHGFAPQFTVRDPSGDVFDHVTAPFLPQDGNLTSSGVLKLPDARPLQLAIEGVFAPTAALDPSGLLVSGSPVPTRPAVAVFVDEGNLGLDTGRPQSVYAIDRTQLLDGALRRVAVRTLFPGGAIRLSDGTRITFDGYTQWANLQVSHDPAQDWVLLAAVLIVAGLLLSLRVRRRRLWVRITPTADGSRVTVGGLARSDAEANTREFATLSRVLGRTAETTHEGQSRA